MAYQLPGSVGSLSCSEMLCQRQEEHYCATQNGQHHSSCIWEQAGWNSVHQTEHHSQGTMALVHEQRCYSGGQASGGSPQYDCGPGIPSNEGPVRLDVESQDLQQDPAEMGSTRSGHVCIQTNNSAEKVLQLETRPGSRSSECLQPELEQPTGKGLCQPPLESSWQSVEQNTTATSHTGPSGSSMEEPAVVSHPTGDAGRLPNPPPTHGGSNHTNTPRGCASSTASSSRMAYLRQRFQDKEISEEGTELLLASWRQKSSKSYDSLFGKWVDWCNQRHSDPVSGPISEVVNFLAHLFKEGYQYRSLNAYRLAISSVHEKADGYEVGQHPLVSRLLKGVFNQRPPKPRYEVTWDVTKVLNYIDSLGESDSLSLQVLTWKLAMILALTRPSRSADLVRLDLRYRRHTPEGVVFQEPGLAKQSRQGKPRAEFFFPAFPSNSRLCPQQTLRAYEQRTESFRTGGNEEQTRLFLAVVRPHKPVCSSTLARWLKSLLDKAGIDTSIFKAHSTRSATASAAANTGITTGDILKAADWSSETVFTKFYYKPLRSGAFGEAVLSNSGN